MKGDMVNQLIKRPNGTEKQSRTYNKQEGLLSIVKLLVA